MFWNVNYIIDDGYEYHKKVCIIKADSEEKALEILHTNIGSKLKGERHIVDKYINITKCENEIILYDGPI